jgi:hypothetical protein
MNWETGNHSPEFSGEAPSDIERAFATDIFEQELREKQKDAWQAVDATNTEAVANYFDSTADMTSTYIVNAGVSADDEKYESLYQTARKYSWDTMTDNEWHGDDINFDEPETVSAPGDWRLQAEQTELFGRQILPDGTGYVSKTGNQSHDSETEPTTSNLEQLQAEIDTAAREASLAYAKRMKVGFFRRNKRAMLQDALDEKSATLSALTKQRDDLLIEQLSGEGLNDDEIVQKLAEITNGEVGKQSDGRNDAVRGIVPSTESNDTTRSNYWNRFSSGIQEEYANATIRRKLVLGLGAAALVGGATVLTGGLGAVGAVGLVGTKVVRTYTLKRAEIYKRPEEPEPLTYRNEDGSIKSVDEFRNSADEYRKNVVDERIEKTDKIKRRAVYWALGSAAMIGVGAIAEHWEPAKQLVSHVKNGIKDGFENAWDKFHHPDGNVLSISPQPPTSTPEVPPITSVPEQPPIAVPEQPPMTGPGTIDANSFHDALTFDNGEGWNQTFGELGIMNARDQAALLNNDVLMGKLSNMGLAYPDARVGGWGIRMTPDGKMPTAAADLIRQTAFANHLVLAR